jgi:hypothetical protein
MEQILEKVMNFINENTMLLIIICIFLIVILVIYLIDNTIKSKRLEKEELANNSNNTPEPKVLDAAIPETEAAPVVETVAPVVEEATPVVPEETPVEPKAEVSVETPVVEEPKVEVPVEPVVTTTPVVDNSIEELLNKDYTANNEIVNSIPNEPVVEPPKSKYTNDKKLSDIFGKKEETPKKIDSTQDFSDELDRILKKLNEEDKVNSSMEETSDYTNMF